MFLIYKVFSPSNKIYIGLTSESLEKRKGKHLDCAIHNRRKGKFQNAIRKYGNSLIWEILEEVSTKQEAIEKEIYYIDKFDSFKNGYNCTLGGESNYGMKHSEKTKRLMSKKAKGRIFSKNHRKKLSLAQKRHKNSEDVRNAMALQRGAKEFLVLDKNNNIVGEYICVAVCARKLKVQTSNINKVFRGLRNHTGGYRFIYKENYFG